MVTRGLGSRSGEDMDPITLEVLWSRTIAILDEASATLYRTAFSSVVRESNDYACVLTDTKGMSLAQSSLSIPSFIGTLPQTVRQLQRFFPAHSLRQGDALICNDPWMGTGHLNDINVVLPIFRDSALIGYAASTAHAPDIGGRLLAPDSREVFEEGLQIPPLKLFQAGQVNQPVLDFIERNVRVPAEVLGDLEAQMAANRVTESRLLELLDEYEMAGLSDLGAAIQRHSEDAMRAAIRELPPGTYEECFTLTDLAAPLELRLKLSVDADEGTIVCDYDGTSPQQSAACNVVFAYTFAYTAFAVKCVVAPYVPNNEGCFRPIVVQAPQGSVLNARFPAAVGMRHWVGHHLPAIVMDAFAQVIPHRVRAQSGQPNWVIVLSGERSSSEPFVAIFFHCGGMGAAEGHDGLSCIAFPSNVSNTPVEVLEQLCPITVRRRELRIGSGGTGRWEGGMGQVVEFDVHDSASPLVMSLWTSHINAPARGHVGGGPGALGVALLNSMPLDYQRQILLQPGDRVTLMIPGGGGYGERDLSADVAGQV